MMLSGKIECQSKSLDLELTLLGGQSFRWKTKKDDLGKTKFIGVMHGSLWEIQKNEKYLEYTVHRSEGASHWNQADCEDILKKYFRLDFNLEKAYIKWRSNSEHFKNTVLNFSGVRVLDQEPIENIISFICSQNNNISRISSMIEWLCSTYGNKICSHENIDYYEFPSLKSLDTANLEDILRSAKFGYRAKYIAKAVKHIISKGGVAWIYELKMLPYKEARVQLLGIPGIGPKVADCICLMSLNHLEAVPVDTHIFKIAQKYYLLDLKTKNNTVVKMNSGVYGKVGDTFREIFGSDAGWAQTVLFCSDLNKFKRN